ncbi:MAG: sigma-70 family RNA polymerase sigma factor [Firmicutes bacterium]|nr:sigma-70 family RNA polymerase sigma factor [Bacillota bacterium]
MDNHQRDLTLVQRWVAGDDAAGHQLVDENFVIKLLGFITKLVTNAGIRENKEDLIHDVCQEALVRAFSNAQSFNGTSSFYTWVCSISKNCLREHLKELTKYSHDELSETTTDHLDSAVNIDFGNPETIYLQREQRKLFFDALNSLKEDYKQIILFRLVEGKKYAEIEKLMGKSTPALESLYRRACHAFKQRYCELNGYNLQNGFSEQQSLNK